MDKASPEAAEKQQGVSIIEFAVDTKGSVTEARLVGSSGSSSDHKIADEETLAKLQTCSGKPATTDGRPTKVRGRLEYRHGL